MSKLSLTSLDILQVIDLLKQMHELHGDIPLKFMFDNPEETNVVHLSSVTHVGIVTVKNNYSGQHDEVVLRLY